MSPPAEGRPTGVSTEGARAVRDVVVGTEITGPVRLMTTGRIECYDSAMPSAARGELAQVGSNIHTDEESALGF